MTETTAERILIWRPGRGLTAVEGEPPGGDRLLAADSWLVRDGRVRGLARHRERFRCACAVLGGPSAGQLDEFWRSMTDALPRTGAWFPRVELVPAPAAPRLRLRLRVAPALASRVRVWAAGQLDPRTVPRRKGPDLDALAGIRRRASVSGQGAEEAVLTTPSGVVLEAANSSVLWWEEETLCLPSPQLPVLAGVTAGFILERAGRSGIRIVHRARFLEELDSREVWLVNALHGIRPVTGWTGTRTGEEIRAGRPMRAGPAPHAAEWQKWLDDIAEPLQTG
jgi:branched-subunit amino acid aminotransferase/4-amino-4-deoxychorismate lyase